jgi:hypothetical protein
MQAAGEATDAGARHHAMARNDDRDRVGAERLAYGARRARLADAPRDVAVGDEGARGDAGGRLQDAALEFGHAPQVERHGELAALAAQESPELATKRREAGVIAHRGRAVLALDLAPEFALGAAHAEIRQPARGGSDVQLPHRRGESGVSHDCACRRAARCSRGHPGFLIAATRKSW